MEIELLEASTTYANNMNKRKMRTTTQKNNTTIE